MTWKSLPTPLKLFFAADLVVAMLYVANQVAGTPFVKINRLVDLDGEANLPTWYSSMQWAAAAALFAFAAYRLRLRGRSGAFPLLVMAAVFFLLSMDEVAQVHEKLSIGVSGKVGAGQGRWKGMWLPALGIPVLGLLGLAARRAQGAISEVPGCFRCLVAGLVVFALGAFGIEPVLNVAQVGAGPTLVVIEETLEMLGVTFLLTAAYQLSAHEGLLSFQGRQPRDAERSTPGSLVALSQD